MAHFLSQSKFSKIKHLCKVISPLKTGLSPLFFNTNFVTYIHQVRISPGEHQSTFTQVFQVVEAIQYKSSYLDWAGPKSGIVVYKCILLYGIP